MALILTRTTQRLVVVHDQDPSTDKAIGTPYGGGFRSSNGQPSDATRISLSPVSGDVLERSRQSAGVAAFETVIDAAHVEFDGEPTKYADMAYGWVYALHNLILESSRGPLESRPSESQSTLPGEEQPDAT